MTAITIARDPMAVGEPTAPRRGVGIALLGVRRSFGPREVLRGIDLAVEAGQFVAVVGPSGCGKSTLLRLLNGIDAPDGGRIAFERPTAARIMFQEARLLPWARVADNVAVGLGPRRKEPGAPARVLEALAAVGLSGREADWPAALSGGQRQRVALARALVSEPGFLALDEPFGALDALTRIGMQSLLERVWREQGFTAVLVTHDVSEALALADRVLLIEEGRIALDLPVDLPRPRRRGSVALAALEERILRILLRQDRDQPDYMI
ncbi:ATP-binding cassette domain-containing protein [Arenibaculum pallidiluteum]|uniref:ATP-binding cassette domain-containing protein n=1 Tax=Arenibaculum pallidiluteum TaxID=2812559 RepID=UPI001F33F8E0|nr:ATP-binding cassette domain-containing protein [Arenibaculum pallidiluteum]